MFCHIARVSFTFSLTFIRFCIKTCAYNKISSHTALMQIISENRKGLRRKSVDLCKSVSQFKFDKSKTI